MKPDVVPFGWRPRAEPLAAVAAVATGSAVSVLVRRLLLGDDDALARLHGIVTSDREVVVVLGEASLLPWFDGVLYLGRDPRAPALLTPTVLEPDVPIELVERAFVRRIRDAGPPSLRGTGATGFAAPLAILVDVPRIVPCGPALPLARARLLEVQQGHRAA